MDENRFEHKIKTQGIAIDKICGKLEKPKQKHLFIDDQYMYWNEDPNVTTRDDYHYILLSDIVDFTEGAVSYSEYFTINTTDRWRKKIIMYIKDKETFEHFAYLLSQIISKNAADREAKAAADNNRS
eukprot:TRINITY_DN42422_c0_g1_i1.p1 TRINITY_DN42422_c0_g1~~TRINITY_DN42422_c0_g1_i1.p1  ORF type:complete len:127 (-),score=1.77 TRINITY_DN42422_c0_g1_i1:100-480(-)